MLEFDYIVLFCVFFLYSSCIFFYYLFFSCYCSCICFFFFFFLVFKVFRTSIVESNCVYSVGDKNFSYNNFIFFPDTHTHTHTHTHRKRERERERERERKRAHLSTNLLVYCVSVCLAANTTRHRLVRLLSGFSVASLAPSPPRLIMLVTPQSSIPPDRYFCQSRYRSCKTDSEGGKTATLTATKSGILIINNVDSDLLTFDAFGNTVQT